MYKRILLDSTHFQDICDSVRSINIAWDAILRTNEISESDATNLKIIELEIKRQFSQKVEQAKAQEKDQAEDVQIDNLNISLGIVQSIVHTLETSENNDVRKVASNILATLLLNDQYNEIIAAFVSDKSLITKLFENVLVEKDDLQTNTINAFNVVSLLVQDSLIDTEKVEKLLINEQFILILQNVRQMDTCYVMIRLLQELATIKQYRSIIWSNEKQLLPTIFTIVEKPISKDNTSNTVNNNANNANSDQKLFVNTNINNLSIQLQYYSLLLVWLLTFDNKIIVFLVENYLDKILNLLKLVKITIKEKISRLCISIILQICLPDGQKENKKFIKNLILLSNGIPTTISLIERKYSDEELRNDLIKLKEILEAEYTELTTFDEYLAELDSKLLCWSPPHINNSFWVDNIDQFKKDNWKIFKRLINLLFEIQNENKDTNARETNVKLQVLLNDITHVIELMPDESITMLNKLNGKVIIMELLNHNDSRVKFEALKATQSIIGYTFK